MAKEDDVEALCAEDPKRTRARAVLAGIVNLLRPGPEELITAILAGCLLALALAVLALVPAIVALGMRGAGGGVAGGDVCPRLRTSHGRNGERLTNVYFVKHENRTWTAKELCSIESAARHYTEFNFIVLNLVQSNDSSVGENALDAGRLLNDLLDSYTVTKAAAAAAADEEDLRISSLSGANDFTEDLNYRIINVPNVRNVDVDLDGLFKGSQLSRKIRHLRRDEIELAAKYQILWNWPGVALEPLVSYQLESYRNYINTDKSSAVASIQAFDDFQASSVPCQAFIGAVIDKIAKSASPDRQTVLNSALADFCSSFTECSGVRFLKQMWKKPPNFTTCPNVDDILDLNVNTTIAEMTISLLNKTTL